MLHTLPPTYAVTEQLFKRYQKVLSTQKPENFSKLAKPEKRCSLGNLQWMCSVALENMDQFPIDKLSRWLGFIQGVMCTHGLISVDGERDFSRPLFQEAYMEEGINIPASQSLDN